MTVRPVPAARAPGGVDVRRGADGGDYRRAARQLEVLERTDFNRNGAAGKPESAG
jgi:hypothetical protein